MHVFSSCRQYVMSSKKHKKLYVTLVGEFSSCPSNRLKTGYIKATGLNKIEIRPSN